jgi:uncharacterized protein YcfJ
MANQVSFGNWVDPEQQELDRNRLLAQALQKQAAQPIQQEMVGGRVVRKSPLEGIAKIAQALAGGYMNNQADEQQRGAIAGQRQNVNDYIAALRGSPEMPSQNIGSSPERDFKFGEKNLDLTGQSAPDAIVPGQAAVAPDEDKALAIALKTPALQEQAKKMLDQQGMMHVINKLRGGGGGGAPSQGGSAFAGVGPEVTGLMLSGYPDLQKLAGMVQETQKPIPLREGDLIVPDGKGGFVSKYTQPKMDAGMQPVRDANGQVIGAQAIPGYGPGAASIKGAAAGATANANAQNEMVTIDVPPNPSIGEKGGPKMMTRAQAIELANQNAQSQNGVPPTAQTQPPMPQGGPLPPGQPIPGGMPPGGMSSGSQKGLPPLPPGMPSGMPPMGQQPSPSLTASQSQPGFPTPTMARGPGIPLQSDEAKTFATERAKDFAKQAGTYADNAAKASSMLGTIGTLKSLYSDPNIAKGGGAEFTSGIKNAAASIGVDIKGLGSEQAIQSITNKMAIDLRSTGDGGGMPGSLSDGDRKFLVSMTPGLSKTPEGRAMIMDAQERVAKRQMDVAKMATQYEQQYGKLDIGFQQQLQDYSAKNPLFADMKMPTQAGATPSSHPQEIGNLLNKYGGSRGATGGW